jgi:hypothetical protein
MFRVIFKTKSENINTLLNSIISLHITKEDIGNLILAQSRRILVFNVTFCNISSMSWRPVLVVEEAGVSGENHRPLASNW